MRRVSARSVFALLVCAVLACLLLSPATAVDRKKFRTCQDTAFCKRNRAQAADGFRGPHRYNIPVSRHSSAHTTDSTTGHRLVRRAG